MSTGVPALDERALRQALAGEPFVTHLSVLERVGSTNDELRRLGAVGAPAGTVVLAETQSAGRGRLGRSWHSPRGLGLYLSILLRPGRPAEELTRWTLAAAVAAGEACRDISRSPVLIDWPNDLVWSDRKLGGVLAEARSAGGATQDLIVGVGINVFHGAADFPGELQGRATSLLLAAGGVRPDRERLATAYLSVFAELSAMLEAGEWHAVARRFTDLSPGVHGRAVRLLGAEGPAAAAPLGITDGLDERGALRVRMASGQIHLAHLGESLVDVE